MKIQDAEKLWRWGIDSLKDKNPDMIEGILQTTVVKEIIKDKVRIKVDNQFMKDWILERLMDSAISKFREFTQNDNLTIELFVEKFEKIHIDIEDTEQVAKKLKKTKLNPKYNLKSFVVGTSNQFAHAVSHAVAKTPGTLYNPLFIYGGVGLGKTHLLQAIGNHVIIKNPEADILYVTCEEFLNDMIDSMGSGKLKRFRKKYRTVDVLLIDDIQFLAGKTQTQEEIFNTFNELHNSGKQIVLSSDRPPHEIQKVEKRLISRFESGMIADIQAPDYELRMAILKKHAEVMKFKIDDSVLSYLVDKITSNIRKLEGAFTTLIGKASILKKEITISLVDEVLKNHTSQIVKPITIDNILKIVSVFFNIDIEQIKGKRRSKQIVFPRQISMFLSRELTSSTLDDIGENLGKRDHSTVLYACNKIEEEIKNNPDLKQEIEELKKRILEN